MHQAGIATVGDLARADVARLHAMFGATGPHLHELAMGLDPRPVVGDYERKSYGEENTFEHDLALDSLELARVLIAHSDALGRRLRADHVRARTVTLKLKLARPLGQGRYPIVTRSQSLKAPTDDGAELSRVARALLERVLERERVRLAGVQVHNLVRDAQAAAAQLALFGATPAQEGRRDRLNSALDKVAERFGEDAVTRGLAHAERAAPTRRIK
jgi:DNA polymerase-4